MRILKGVGCSDGYSLHNGCPMYHFLTYLSIYITPGLLDFLCIFCALWFNATRNRNDLDRCCNSW